jgi:hypothetical protein
MTPQDFSAPTNRVYLLEARRFRNIFIPSEGGMEGEKEGGKEQGGGTKKGDHGKTITFPDLMYWMWSVLGTNERFSADATTPVRLSFFNTSYTQWVKWMKEQDKWRDQHDKSVTSKVITLYHNELAPLLDKIVDKDDKIPSGKQVSDIQGEFRVVYFNSLTSDNSPEPVSSEDEVTKTGCLDMLTNARTNNLHKFHPIDLYIYFHFGSSSVGG